MVKSGYFEKRLQWRAPIFFPNGGGKNINVLVYYQEVGIDLKYCLSTVKNNKNVLKSGCS